MKTTKHQHTEPHLWRGVSISVKLFYYLALFTLFMLLVVWVLQIGLLDYFYSETKLAELNMTDRIIVDTLQNHPDDLTKVVEEYGTEYLTCIRVFRVKGTKALPIADFDISGDCLLHHMPAGFLGFLYNQTSDAGGEYTWRFSPSDVASMVSSQVPPEAGEENGGGSADVWKQHFLNHTSVRTGVNILRVRLLNGQDGQRYLVALNSELALLSTTESTLQTQFWVIAIILLIGALVLSWLISMNISRPIRQMNRAAKRLAQGHYDANFTVSGYKEVMELSDSLTHASQELSKNDVLQKELLANISHDLRTPLTMIIGYSEVMRDLPGENTPENIQVIIDETQRLSNLVNDLLDLSKLQAGTRKPTVTRFDLTELVESTMKRYEKLIQKDGYRVEFFHDAHVEVMADQTMILQVIYNLINNAINYTGEDKLVRVTQQIGPTGRVRISVTDSGEGIPADQIPLIWDRYYKVDKVHRRAMVGTGLGLSIVKHILEQHESTYGVESKLGEGSTFWFELTPVASPDGSDDARGGNCREKS